MKEIPKTNCKGCDDRDRLIKVLARRVNELEGNDIVLELPTLEEYARFMTEMELLNGRTR